MNKQDLKGIYYRSIIFGTEDSLVSTVGLLSGVAASGAARATVITTGLVLLAVEGFSMGAGSFLSERSVEEYTGNGLLSLWYSIISGFIMFASYVVAGLISLAPYFFNIPNPMRLSIGLSFIALFTFGAVSASKYRMHWFSRGLRMLTVGGLAIAMGIVIGRVL